MTNFLINFVQFFNNQQNLQIIEVMQPNYLEVLFLPSTLSFLLLISSGRKNKKTELDDKRLIFCHENVGGTRILSNFAITDLRW